jgi:hypothetical protein
MSAETERISGRVVILVEADDPESVHATADVVAQRLREEGHAVFRASARDFVRGAEIDGPFLRSALLDAFRAGESFPLVGSRANGDILFDPLWTSAPRDACLVVEWAH